jgi:YVTN family beta-propeller protein
MDVAAIDLTSNTVLAQVRVTGTPYGLAMHPSGGRVFVGLQEGAGVEVIDTASNTVTGTIRTVGQPVRMIPVQVHLSSTRAATMPPINTMLVRGGTGGRTALVGTGGGKEQAHTVPTTAAGSPPISTFGTPGARTAPVGAPGGWPIVDPTRAAG